MLVVRRAILHCRWVGVLAIVVLSACSENTSETTSNSIVDAWKSAGLEPVELSESSDHKLGECLSGKVANLHVDLCIYSDALAADSAKEAGLAKIGSFTGAALVRERYLLVVSDVDKVDVHGKTLNTLAKIFLKPSIASSESPWSGS